MPDEFAIPEVEGPGRAKRSPINTNRVGGLNVETLVVADRKMLEKHGRDNVTTYILTVMNMVRAREGRRRNEGSVTYEIMMAQTHVGKIKKYARSFPFVLTWESEQTITNFKARVT